MTVKLYKDDIFPTEIYFVDDLLEQNEIDIMKKDIYDTYVDKVNWQSKPDLYKNLKYKTLTNKIIEASKIVLEHFKFYDYEAFKITDMWSNILKPGEMHRPHTHSNNILSGVYYVQSDEKANIQFYDPRPQAGVLQPSISKWNKGNASIWFYPSKTNRLIIFPSWLTHFVPVNTSKENRLSIAFNVMLKGKFGTSEQLQSSIF